MKKFIYCIDEGCRDKLILRGFKLIRTNTSLTGNIYIFENKPEYFSKDFTIDSLKSFCTFEDKLRLTF